MVAHSSGSASSNPVVYGSQFSCKAWSFSLTNASKSSGFNTHLPSRFSTPPAPLPSTTEITTSKQTHPHWYSGTQQQGPFFHKPWFSPLPPTACSWVHIFNFFNSYFLLVIYFLRNISCDFAQVRQPRCPSLASLVLWASATLKGRI